MGTFSPTVILETISLSVFICAHELSKLKLPEFMEHGSEKSQEIFWIKLPHNLFYST